MFHTIWAYAIAGSVWNNVFDMRVHNGIDVKISFQMCGMNVTLGVVPHCALRDGLFAT